jgi:glycerophosphoryl diester phosphodiesterase
VFVNRFLDLLASQLAHPVTVAHRGDSFRAPENTLEAARKGWEAGAEAWELDVQLSRDGVPIVIHDETLLRTTNVYTKFAGDERATDGYRVSDFDFDEIRSLDAGSWFVAERTRRRSARDFGTMASLEASDVEHYRSGRVIIPTLAEALSFTKDHDWLVNVEIKSFPERPHDLVEPVLRLIAETGVAPHVLISSFDHRDVAAANVLGRSHALGILTMSPIFQIGRYGRELVGCDTVHVSTAVIGAETDAYRRDRSRRWLDCELMDELKRSRLPVLVYTVNDHGPGSLADDLAGIGVAGLFTDDPLGLRGSFQPGTAT